MVPLVIESIRNILIFSLKKKNTCNIYIVVLNYFSPPCLISHRIDTVEELPLPDRPESIRPTLDEISRQSRRPDRPTRRSGEPEGRIRNSVDQGFGLRQRENGRIDQESQPSEGLEVFDQPPERPAAEEPPKQGTVPINYDYHPIVQFFE